MFNFMLLTAFTTVLATPVSHDDKPADMEYYEGQWTCRGSQNETLGTLKVVHAFGDRFHVFTWSGDLSSNTTYTSYDSNKKLFVRAGLLQDGSRILMDTIGWDSTNTLVWAGEINIRNGPTVFVRITETQQDASTYSTTYESSTDGTTYNQDIKGLCTRGS